ncbi:predicted protein [Uncinocarpus reesii 1704]|uniref:Tyrosine specific protein phosphatases domain-containing protein n=1 Tax=Uncinocarpus reesii (strain UAMH 1704) TaxID=336963 RepID=C4JST8_UNCRE|nr:uncharacterized protein UREG_05527 [Uncinocarpus reesii 1704]EEP80685.1 predicted protein [Uncinocarpus reesii 1704]
MATLAQNTDLETLVKTDVLTAIAPNLIQPFIASRPFIFVPGTFNLRDIGQPTCTPPVRSNFLYRSGMLSSITDAGVTKLVLELGVKKIFDLRSAKECEAFPAPYIADVEIRWLPPAQEPRPVVYSEFGAEDGGLKAMVEFYKDILVTHVPVYKEVFEHIRDERDNPIVFHCAGGKDRTGVLTALILGIAGCSPDVIAREYVLTRIGVEPARSVIMGEILTSDIASDPVKRRGFAGLCSVNYETMIQFLEHLEGCYENGAEGYVKSVLGFSDDDVAKIRENLTA